MKLGNKTIVAAAAAASSLIALAAAPGLANHAWSNYHWERTTAALTVPVIDNTTGVWTQKSYVAVAVDDWNNSTYINSPLTQGNADPSCPLVGAEIHVCNDNYGGTGWVGIASISVTRGRTTHIIAGVTKLNDYYFDQPYYNNDTWRQLVTCQEIGHDYGLGHQNENFDTDVTNSCMEYTSAPAGNEHPDQHDYDMLAQIYAHSHDGGSTSGPPGGGRGKKLGVVGNTPADWGKPIGYDARGRANVYKREMKAYDIITHVTWAVGAGPEDHQEERGPRQHSGDLYFQN